MTRGSSADAVEDVWGFDDSVLELNLLLRQLLDRSSRQAIEDEKAWRELFGPLLGREEVRRLLRVESGRDIDQLVKNRKLLALPTREGEVVYPAFQFDKRGNVYPDIESIIGIFAEVVATPFTIASWLRGPKEYLEGHAPIRWLELERDPELVLAGAEVAAARLAS